MTQYLFAYGTLLPGDERWSMLSRFVVDQGVDDHVSGVLYDTGLGYPTAVFDTQPAPQLPSPLTSAPLTSAPLTSAQPSLVTGRTFALLDHSVTRAFEILDAEEDVDLGLFCRDTVVTGRGITAWAYRYGGGLELSPIASGDWLGHRGLR